MSSLERLEAMEKLQESIHESTMKFLSEMGVKYAELEKLLDTIGKRLDSLEQKEHTHE
tara:strand:+ start:496 stop:669 length:174 start_codon:yes stop_codon:yes gene_type:complete